MACIWDQNYVYDAFFGGVYQQTIQYVNGNQETCCPTGIHFSSGNNMKDCVPNPVTGNYNCPAGFTAAPVASFIVPENKHCASLLYACFANRQCFTPCPTNYCGSYTYTKNSRLKFVELIVEHKSANVLRENVIL
jgi:hypothetical protein